VSNIAVAVALADAAVWDASGVSKHRHCAKAKPDRKQQGKTFIVWLPTEKVSCQIISSKGRQAFSARST
jgi:hypothetical protein